MFQELCKFYEKNFYLYPLPCPPISLSDCPNFKIDQVALGFMPSSPATEGHIPLVTGAEGNCLHTCLRERGEPRGDEGASCSCHGLGEEGNHIQWLVVSFSNKWWLHFLCPYITLHRLAKLTATACRVWWGRHWSQYLIVRPWQLLKMSSFVDTVEITNGWLFLWVGHCYFQMKSTGCLTKAR